MKRRTHPVRQGGVSPYVRHNKAPFLYSPAYYAWRRGITGKAAKSEMEAAQRRNGNNYAHQRRAA